MRFAPCSMHFALCAMLNNITNNLGNTAMEKFKHFMWFQLPAIAWAAAIFIQSSMSDIDTPDLGFDFQDKVFHAIEYAILGYLLRRAMKFQRNNFINDQAGWLTILIGSTYAISDEFHQYFVPGRSADTDDAIADIIGVILVVVIYFIVKKVKLRKSRQ